MNPKEAHVKKAVAEHRDEGLIGTFIARGISRRITKLVARTSLTPNQVTILSFLTGVLASYLITKADYASIAVGGILVYFSYILDNVDGEIARLKDMGSKRGLFLDTILDRAKEGVIFFCIGLALFRLTGEYIYWAYAFIAAFSVFMTNIVVETSGKVDKENLKKIHGSVGIIRWLKERGIKQSYLSLGVDLQLFIICIGALVNRLDLVLWFFMTVQNLYWMVIFAMVLRRLKGKLVAEDYK